MSLKEASVDSAVTWRPLAFFSSRARAVAGRTFNGGDQEIRLYDHGGTLRGAEHEESMTIRKTISEDQGNVAWSAFSCIAAAICR